MRGKAFGAIALLFPFTAGGILLSAVQKHASANSAPAYWEGADATGALLKKEQCPIAVESELLTLNIPEFPPLGSGEEAFRAYGANVTARYTFRNPTDAEYTATLLFPFGAPPDYYADCETYDFYGDTARYAVKEDGDDVAVRTRHSYCGGQKVGGFDVEREISRLEGGEKSFFQQDTPVTAHTFHVTSPEEESGHTNFLTLCFKLIADPAKTRIAASAPSNGFIEKGLAVVTYGFAQTRGDFDFTLYAFGEDVTFKKQGVYDNRAEGVLFDGAAVEETQKTAGTYGAFVMDRYPGADSGMSGEDWYCGFTAAMAEYRGDGMMCSAVPDEISAADFMRWYEYDLQFPAGEEVVNEVTAPIYPTVRGSGTGAKYDYTYLLSPARKWASFGSLRVELKTPYYLTASSLDFEETEGGYVLEWEDGLPLGELTFTLSETEPGGGGGFAPYRDGPSALFLGIVVLLVVAVVAAGVTIILLVIRHSKKPQPPAGGGAAEGKVDLPPEDENRKK